MGDAKDTAEELLAKEAAAWVQRLKTAGPKEQAEFARWLRESRAHVREMLLASSWEVVLRHLGHEQRSDVSKLVAACDNVEPVKERREPAETRVVRALRWPWIAAMGLSLAVTAAVLLGALPFLRETLRHEYVTAVGEQRSITLVDGSIISLNAKSSVRIDFSQSARDVYLSDGQAMFNVAHDTARPFRVYLGSSIAQAVGTQFDIHRLPSRIDVAVLEGRVQVARARSDSAAEPSLQGIIEKTQLAAGEALSINSMGDISAPASVAVEDIGAWRQRRLVVRNRPLSEIVDEFQRYNRVPQMRVEGIELRARMFNGVFDADDPETLVDYLATDDTIVVDRRGDELIIRLRSNTE